MVCSHYILEYVVAMETLQSFLLLKQLEFARKKLDELNVSTVLIHETQQLYEYIFVYELGSWQLKNDATYK